MTDFFDGYLARRWAQQSALGRMLDPIADKVLVAAMLLVLAADRDHRRRAYLGGDHHPVAARCWCRACANSSPNCRCSVPVTRLAKWKTTVQLVAIGFLIAGPAGDRSSPYDGEFGLAGLWIAAGFTLYTGYDYFRAGIGHVMDENK